MTDWPPIDEPELVARLGLDEPAFRATIQGFIASVGPRPFDDAAYMLALGYPWPRPPRSFRLTGTEVVPLEAFPEPEDAPRWPLLAFGSNGSPETLMRKFAHLPEPARSLPVVAGDLHDFDVVAAAHPTAYGSFPATLFPSPGAHLRAAVLWVTGAQLTALCWTEVSYLLGRLDGVCFVPDIPGAVPVASLLAFASRWGAHAVDGEVAALAALSARGRTLPEHTQEELLGRLALEVLGAGASARDLVAWIYEDFGAAVKVIAPLTVTGARPFDCRHWTRYPPA